MIQNEVHYTGRVQGVGFRFTTQRVAGRHSIAGFVENLPDGRVRVIVQGTEAAVRDFLSDVESTMSDCIREVDLQNQPVSARFGAFEIRR